MARIKYKEALGLEVKTGRPSTGQTPSKEDLVRLYLKEGRSIREVAQALGRSKDMVARALKGYGIEARAKVRRSGLRKYGLQGLGAAAREKGIRKTARDMGVNPSTLSRFLRSETEK